MTTKKKEDVVVGFKGFGKDLRCQSHQYKIGGEYTHEGAVELCASGLHFCEDPMDVFSYYAPAGSRFAEVEAVGVSDERDSDSKRVCKTLRIKVELTLKAMVEASIKFVLEKSDKSLKQTVLKDSSVASNSGYSSVASNSGDRSVASNSGDRSVASNSGDSSVASNSGYRSVASNSGDSSVASNSGDRSVASNSGYRSVASNSGYRSVASNEGAEGCAVSLGIEAKAKGCKGAWLTLAEWKETRGEWHRIDVQTVQVDGEVIKEDTLYSLAGGKFVEVPA